MIHGASLFAGIGGFDLAMERNGIGVTFMSEIDTACQAVLGNHFPKAHLVPDVREVTANDIIATGFLPGEGILTAGWPCQGNSVAGRRQGMADPRSGLWREVARILGELRPRWFIGENPGRPGVLTVRGGADFHEILQSLDELGYGVAWRVLDAQNFGVPQRRRRVLFAGCLGDGAVAAEVLFEPEGGGGHPPQGRQAGPDADGTPGQRARSTRGTGPGGAVSTLQGGGRRGYRVDAEAAAGGHLIAYSLNAHPVFAGPAVRRLTPRECERLQGFPDNWTRWTADGKEQSDSARYRQLGNAVAVPVIGWLMRRIQSTSNRGER